MCLFTSQSHTKALHVNQFQRMQDFLAPTAPNTAQAVIKQKVDPNHGKLNFQTQVQPLLGKKFKQAIRKMRNELFNYFIRTDTLVRLNFHEICHKYYGRL